MCAVLKLVCVVSRCQCAQMRFPAIGRSDLLERRCLGPCARQLGARGPPPPLTRHRLKWRLLRHRLSSSRLQTSFSLTMSWMHVIRRIRHEHEDLPTNDKLYSGTTPSQHMTTLKATTRHYSTSLLSVSQPSPTSHACGIRSRVLAPPHWPIVSL